MTPSIIILGIIIAQLLALCVFIYLFVENITRVFWGDEYDRLKFEPYNPKNVSKADAKAISKALKTKFKGKKIGTAKVKPPKRKS